MSRRSTPTKGRTKSAPICEDVPAEFCKRVLSLMASFYETPSTTEQLTFPPAKKADPQSPAQKLEFESSITDLRVRRAQEAQAASVATINNSINNRVEEIADKFRNSNIDLDDIFAPETVIRPNTPRYVQKMLDQQLDEKEEIERRKSNRPTRPMDVKGIEKDQISRLQNSKQKGIERAKKRAEKQQAAQAQTPTEKYYRSKTFQNVDDQNVKTVAKRKQIEAKERRYNMTHFKKPEEYQKFAKTKTPEKDQKYFNSDDESD